MGRNARLLSKRASCTESSTFGRDTSDQRDSKVNWGVRFTAIFSAKALHCKSSAKASPPWSSLRLSQSVADRIHLGKINVRLLSEMLNMKAIISSELTDDGYRMAWEFPPQLMAQVSPRGRILAANTAFQRELLGVREGLNSSSDLGLL